MVILSWNLLRRNPRMTLTNAQRIAWQGRAGQKYPEIL
jgi:hypothetical protein